jgi:hypothetical protein
MGGSLFFGGGGTTTAATVNVVGGTNSTIYTNYTSTGVPLEQIGSLSGSGNVTFKNNNGTPTIIALSGSNTGYSGNTNISSGIVQANGSVDALGTGNVSLIGGVLAGTGSTGPSTSTINVSGGKITAGTGATTADTAGTLNTGGQAWNSSGTYVAKYDATGKVDLLIMTGLTVASSGFVINFQTFNGSSAGVPANTYELAEDTESGSANPFNASGSMPALGELTLKVNGLAAPAGYTLSTAVDTTDAGGGFALTLVVATPEPTSLLLAAVAAAPLAMGRRRRRASAAAV